MRISDEEYEGLQKRAIKLAMAVKQPFIAPRISLVIGRCDGSREVIFDRPSRSFVRNFWNKHVFLHTSYTDPRTGFFDDGYWTVMNTAGTILTTSASQFWRRDRSGAYRANVNVDTWGIQVGSDSTPEDFDDFALGTPITDGAGAGQLQYSACDLTNSYWNAGSRYNFHEFTRNFSNGSGGTVNVNEAGIVGRQATNYILFSRDQFSTVAVANGEDLDVIYEFRVYYP